MFVFSKLAGAFRVCIGWGSSFNSGAGMVVVVVVVDVEVDKACGCVGGLVDG